MPRLLAGLLTMTVGAGLGAWLGHGVGSSLLNPLIGSFAALALLAAVDALRGYRLIRWLRHSTEGSAPRDSGLWGEIGYRMERSLRDLEFDLSRERSRLAQFLSAIEASPNGVLLLDSSEQIEWCNRLAADHFGLDPMRDLRQPITNLVHAPAFVDYLRQRQFEAPVVFGGSSGRAMLSVGVRLYGEGQMLVLSQDITQSERTDAMRRDFVANVSHEIRTPLTVLAGFIETMTQLQLSDVERKRVLALMSQQARRMQTLVDDLLMLAQLEGRPMPPAEHWMTLDRLLEIAEADARALSAGCHLLTVKRATGIEIAGVESEVLSAISNLLHNAVRYTPTGGSIEALWRPASDGSSHLVVSDTGAGIAREHLPRLSERFYRVDGSRSRETGGTGLGLAIVKHVMQRHGGELRIDSELGKGSRFALVFPAARVRLVAASPASGEQVESAATGVV